jgi:Peptidase U49
MKASPIRELDNAIAASPFRISTTAESALKAIVAAKSLTLEYCACKRLKARLVIDRSAVQLGVPFLEALWAAAHAYSVVFHECQQANKRGDEFLDIGGMPRTAQAYSLYRKQLELHAAERLPDWASTDSRPVRFPDPNTDAFVANELFLVATSWLIHHEIAHARLAHESTSKSSQQEENEADRLATQWVCGETKEVGQLHKAAFGIATAVLFLIALDLERGRVYSHTHPPAFERLILNLDETGLGEDEMIYAFAFKLVEIHLIQAKLAADVAREGTHRDKCVALCMLIRGAAKLA